MELSDRKRKILQIVVDNYIKSPQPISSKFITENHLPDVSSATVRNELNALESMGYLCQPHTSAGRIPSAKAYKIYVNELMTKKGLTRNEINYIEQYLSNQVTGVENIVKSATKLIADITNYTAVAISPTFKDEKIQAIKLIKVTENKIVLVLITDKNNIKDGTFKAEGITEEYVDSAIEMLNKMFVGKSFEEAIAVGSQIDEAFERFNVVLRQILVLLKSCLEESEELYVSGSSKIFEHPEYNNLESARKLISVIDDRNALVNLFKSDKPNFEITINIGGENDESLPESCSLVSANYALNGIDLGTAGVLGPMRMSYDKVISVLEAIGDTIKNMLDNKEE